MAVSRDIVQNYIESALQSEVLEDSFMAFAVPQENGPDSAKVSPTCPGMKRILLTISTNSEPDKIIKHYVDLMSQVKSPAKFDMLFDLLKLLVQQHPNLSKAVCIALLSRDHLDYYNQNSWLRSFALISDILPTIDYKGVRDILKLVLEIIYSLPEKFDIAIIPQLDILYATFSMILDREACLLPAYLSLDELQKKIANNNAPVWKFAELFYYFIESFRPTAQIFSIVNRPDLLPVVGCSSFHGNASWELDPISAKFQLKGLLPYNDRLKEPQSYQLRYLLEQYYSKEVVFNILAINAKTPHPQRARCAELVEQIALTLLSAMDRSESDVEAYENQSADTSEHLFQWIHISNSMSFYIMYNQPALSFKHLVDVLCDKIRQKNLRKGKEHLMWSMLQYITYMGKGSVSDFMPVVKLIELLYAGRRPLQLAREDSPFSPHVYAAASIWHHLVKKSEIDQCRFSASLPPSLHLHYEYISNIKKYCDDSFSRVSYKQVVFLNAYSTLRNAYPIVNFVDCLGKLDPVHNPNPMQAKPLPVALLDCFTTHSKIAVLHTIAQRLAALAQKKLPTQQYLLTPALVETYGRLLMYTDSEQFGIKTFVNLLMGNSSTALWKMQAWHIYHVLLEMYSYRIHHVVPNYKFSMLIQLHQLSPVVNCAKQMQLFTTIEATELKLLLGLSDYEALEVPGMSTKYHNDAKNAKHIVNSDSEELNKVLVIVLAQATHRTATEHVTAGFLDGILTEVNKVTPLNWSSSTLAFFPAMMRDFFSRNASIKENDCAQLRPAVEEEYRKWEAMSNDNSLLSHFSQPNAPPLFICVLWKMLLDNDGLNPVVYRILDNMRIRTLSAHLRTFVDYIVFEFSNSVAGEHVNKYAEALNDLIWKFQIVSLDRLLLCMCLRGFNGCETQVCFFIIRLLLLKISDFKSTVQKFCKMQSPEHWKADAACYDINSEFQRRYPEKYYHDFLADNNIPSEGQTLPSYFSNICIRFIPVFDILIHRAIELRITYPNAAITIDALLDEFGCLYKLHDRPLTYLYNTLHYYHAQLPHPLKRKLTSTIVNAHNEIKPAKWCLSDAFSQYLQKHASAASNQQVEEWAPTQDYYRKLIGRLVQALQNKASFYYADWRFNEFPNLKAHAIHVTAIELMASPLAPDVVGNALIDLALTSHVNQDRATISHWMNAIGLVMTALPQTYNQVTNNKILEFMRSPLLTNPSYTKDILHLLNFSDSYEMMYESQISYLVALTHAIWHHSSTGQVFYLRPFWSVEIKKAVETESQFLLVCCLIGPFLPRFDRSRVVMDVVVDLYEMLGKVDAAYDIQHLDTICDFFYHIKYMFTGDSVKNEIERCIRNFRPKLQYCLRCITSLNINNDPNQQNQQHPFKGMNE